MELQRRHALALCLLPSGFANAAPGPADAQRVLANIHDDYSRWLPRQLNLKLLKGQQADGGWDDVDYADQSAGRWKPAAHLERMRLMAGAAGAELAAGQRNGPAMKALRSSLDYWLKRRPRSTNWWQNTIGQSMTLAPVLVLAGDGLSPEQRQNALALMADSREVQASQDTAQNLVWFRQQQIIRGALTSDAGQIAEAVAAVAATLVITQAEGIQADYSFHQHGAQLYTGGYGLGFARDTIQMAGWVQDTAFAFRLDRLLLLADYVLKGIQPLVRGPWLDWSARGREFTRAVTQAPPATLVAPVRALAEWVPDRQAELLAFAQACDAKTPPTGGTPRTVAFWRSDLLLQRGRGVQASVRVLSDRTVGTESGNGENLLGYWLPFGMHYLVAQGDEYEDLQALWDWAYLPGVTCPDEVPRFQGLLRVKQPFAGCMQGPDATGAAAMQLDIQQTLATKAWFVRGDWLVALGSGITSDHARPVHTTLNQTLWRGSPQAAGEGELAKGGAMMHAGIGYLLGDGVSARWQVGHRAFAASPANPALGPKNAERWVWRLVIEHGIRPRNAGYDYAVWLGNGPAPSNRPYTVLENRPEVQAVRWDDGSCMASFPRAGEVQTAAGVTIGLEQAGLLIARPAGDQWDVTVHDPSQRSRSLGLSLRRGAKAVKRQVTLGSADKNAPPWGRVTI